jgi:hypothetical protein
LRAAARVALAIVKGEEPASDRIWLTSPDGATHLTRARVIQDLPHLAVESAFGIDDGKWGTLASHRYGLLRAVTDAAGEGPGGVRAKAGLAVATAATSAVVNTWGHGPDTPGGVRDRLRAAARRETWVAARIEDLAARLDDDSIWAAGIGARRLYRSWRALPVRGTLRLTWPLLPE